MVIELDPGLVGFGMDRAGAAAARVDRQQHLLALIAGLHQQRQRGVLFLPEHPGEIGESVAVPAHPGGGAPAPWNQTEPDPGVGLAGAGIREVVGRHLGSGRIGDGEPLEPALVDLGIGEEARVGRPEVALETRHLLLGDELGQSMRRDPGNHPG